jgi:hypothetical protein
LPVEGYLRRFYRHSRAVSSLRPIETLAWNIFSLKRQDAGDGEKTGEKEA